MRTALFLTFVATAALAQGVPIKSGADSNVANVNSANALKVGVTKWDGGQDPSLSDKWGNIIEFADDGRVDISQDQILFRDSFVGSAIAAHNKWQQSTLTFTAPTISGGAMTLNPGAVTTAGAYSNMLSVGKFRGFIDGALYVRIRARPVNLPQTNAVLELGLGNSATTGTPTDGLFFRWTTSGGFECVINRGGAETSTSMTAPTADVYSIFSLNVTAEKAWCQYETPSTGANVVTSINLDSAAPNAFVESPGVMIHLYNGGVAPALAPRVIVGAVAAGTKVNPLNRSPGAIAGLQGGQPAFIPTTGANNANVTNSAAPASAGLSNTSAGYTALGGKWQFAAVAGAATDYLLFASQAPTSYRFVVTGVQISTCNTVVASATTPTMMEWGLAVGSSAAALNTTDSTNATVTSAPRRIALGIQSIPVGTAAGGCVADLVVASDAAAPLAVIESGKFLGLVLEMPVGTATATQVIRGTALIRGYYEQ